MIRVTLNIETDQNPAEVWRQIQSALDRSLLDLTIVSGSAVAESDESLSSLVAQVDWPEFEHQRDALMLAKRIIDHNSPWPDTSAMLFNLDLWLGQFKKAVEQEGHGHA
jgi:hypothetical protein